MNPTYLAALLNGLYAPDWLSLNQEEQALLQKAKGLLEQSAQAPKLRTLQAITGRVWQKDKDIQWYYKPQRLTLQAESILPNITIPEFTPDIATKIKDEVDKLRSLYSAGEKAPAFAYSLYHTVYAWGSRLAFKGEQPDVSVFDHNRLLAATVTCLQKQADDGDFLLLKGAISGIQSFIYNDIGGEQIGDAKKASKRLRGRSFLVAHLCQAVAEYVVEELGLELANILFVGGGHFNLLLPKTDDVEDKLKTIRKDLNLGFYKKVGMQLSLLMSWVEVKPALFFQNAAADFSKVTNELEFAKQKRHVDYLDEFFKEAGKYSGQKEKKEGSDDEILGRLVPYANYMINVRANEELLGRIKNKSKAITTLTFIGRHYYLFEKENEVQDFIEDYSGLILEKKGALNIVRLNKTDVIGLFQLSEKNIGIGFNFIGKEAPTGEDDSGKDYVMLFEDIAKLSDNDRELSYPQLAVMRLDVDDLGTLFAYGLGEKPTFGRLSSLSREFQLFFGGYFNELAKKHRLYVTYSGGDDAFVIGSWLNVTLFAKTLYEAFQEFICKNEHISFSAGIFMCSPYYPVVRFAYDAAELLDKKAKEFKGSDSPVGKNAINLFGRTMQWDRFGEMINFAHQLENVVPSETRENKAKEGKNIRRSMLQHLLKTIQLSQQDNSNFEFYRNIGRLHGLFTRHGYGAREMAKTNKTESAKIIETLLQESGNPQRFADFMVPLQYILYKTRVVKQ